ncbi:MAG: S-formylglutathione hydrolase [Polyangiaceae bacterium]
MDVLKTFHSFSGRQLVVKHASTATGTNMEFSLYLPPAAEQGKVPLLVYLSGLTCTWENATTKAGFQRDASELGIAVLCPDTSPRGEGVPNDAAYDLGQGAGFYLNATQAPWSQHFAMERYVVEELLALVCDGFPIDAGAIGITGHSMGGHGALTLAFRHPDRFKSVSALSPIVAPTQVPWGQKAFAAYLGEDRAAWAEHDACELVRRGAHPSRILIDQGRGDEFLQRELRPELFVDAAKNVDQALELRLHDGYDHSYYFIASFMPDHLRHHAKLLRG